MPKSKRPWNENAVAKLKAMAEGTGGADRRSARPNPCDSTSKQVGDPDHLKVFANADAAEAWFGANDPEGVAFECEVIGPPA